MRRLLLIVLAFIVYGSLYPFAFDFNRTPGNPILILLHAWPAYIDRFAWRDAGVNILLYFPLGLAIAVMVMRRWNGALAILAALVYGACLSATIEMLQLFDATRTCSLLDLACNTAGSLAGALAALVFRKDILALTESRARASGGALLLAATWIGYQLYPFIPHLGRGQLRASAAILFATPVFIRDIAASAAEWFAFAAILRAGGRFRMPWLLLALLCLPLRLLVMGRVLAPSELLGAGIALLLWTFPPDRPRAAAAAFVLAAAIVVRELAPFHFAVPPRPMSWVPFAATFNAERQAAALVLLRKAFEYGALLWLLRASGRRYLTAAGFVAAALFALETAQRFMPGHQPEITDAVLALLLAAVLWGLERTST